MTSSDQSSKLGPLPADEVAIDLNSVKLKLQLIPAGTFLMGSPISEVGRRADEMQHKVTLKQPYYMGRLAVTQEQFQQVTGQNPSCFKGKDNPVDTVSWFDAQSFCKKLTEQSKRLVRLPTEAEWEYACRAGTTSKYYSGDTKADLDRAAWYSANSNDTTHSVGQKTPNGFGLYDMHGNVREWCQDWWDESYYYTSPVENPQGPANGTARVLRGGSYTGTHTHCRSASRIWYNPDCCACYFGFRVVVPPSKRSNAI